MVKQYYAKFKFANNDVVSNVPIIVDSYVETDICYNALKSADWSVQFSIPYNTNIANKLKTYSLDDIEVGVYEPVHDPVEGDWYRRIHAGLISGGVTFSKTQQNQPISITVTSPFFSCNKAAEAPEYFLDSTTGKIYSTLVNKAFKGRFYTRCYTYGKSWKELDVDSTVDNAVVPFFKIDKDENYKAVLSDFLFEYGLAFRSEIDISDTGKSTLDCFRYDIFEKPASTSSITQIFDGNNIRNSVNIEEKHIEHGGVAATWVPQERKNSTLLFLDESEHIIDAGKWFPNEASEQENLLDCDSELGTVLYIYNAVTSGSYTAKGEYGAPQLWTASTTDSSGTRLTNQISLKVHAHPTLKTRISKISAKGDALIELTANGGTEITTVSDKKDIESITLKYVHKKDLAQNFAKNLADYYRYAIFTITLDSRTDYPIGTFVKVTDDGIGTIYGRIVKKEVNLTKNIVYTIESYKEFTPATITASTRFLGTNFGPREALVLNVNFDGSFETGDTTTTAALNFNRIPDVNETCSNFCIGNSSLVYWRVTNVSDDGTVTLSALSSTDLKGSDGQPGSAGPRGTEIVREVIYAVKATTPSKPTSRVTSTAVATSATWRKTKYDTYDKTLKYWMLVQVVTTTYASATDTTGTVTTTWETIVEDKEYESVHNITSDDIADQAITASKIMDETITSAKIASAAITTDLIAANAVTKELIGTGAVVSDKIAANAVLTDKLAANAVTVEKLNVLAKSKINNFSVTGTTEGWTLTKDMVTYDSTNKRLQIVRTAAGSNPNFTSAAFTVNPNEILRLDFYVETKSSPTMTSTQGFYFGLNAADTYTAYSWNGVKWTPGSTGTNAYFLAGFYQTGKKKVTTYILGSEADYNDLPAGFNGTNRTLNALKLAAGKTTTFLRTGYNPGVAGSTWYLYSPEITEINGGKIIAQNIDVDNLTVNKLKSTNYDATNKTGYYMDGVTEYHYGAAYYNNNLMKNTPDSDETFFGYNAGKNAAFGETTYVQNASVTLQGVQWGVDTLLLLDIVATGSNLLFPTAERDGKFVVLNLSGGATTGFHYVYEDKDVRYPIPNSLSLLKIGGFPSTQSITENISLDGVSGTVTTTFKIGTEDATTGMIDLEIQQVGTLSLPNSLGNTGIGTNALYRNNIFDNNTAVGNNALKTGIGSGNVSLGAGSMSNAGLTCNNTAIGYNSLQGASSIDTIAIGKDTLHNAQVVSDTIAIGNNAAYLTNSLAHGVGNFVKKSIILGNCALQNAGSLNSIDNTIAIGHSTLQNVQGASGTGSIVIGNDNMNCVWHACNTIAIGTCSLPELTCGSGNIAIGNCSLLKTTTGGGNVAIGHCAGSNITGVRNVVIGHCAGFLGYAGNFNIFIGTEYPKTSKGCNAGCTIVAGWCAQPVTNNHDISIGTLYACDSNYSCGKNYLRGFEFDVLKVYEVKVSWDSKFTALDTTPSGGFVYNNQSWTTRSPGKYKNWPKNQVLNFLASSLQSHAKMVNACISYWTGMTHMPKVCIDNNGESLSIFDDYNDIGASGTMSVMVTVKFI